MIKDIESQMDHAYGCFLGLLCGDAAGATLEFYNRGELTEKVVKKAMTMPGGGQLHVGNGQITDDSELSISLAFSLVDKHPKNGFPLDTVASLYSKWYLSGPFDIGNTCRRAFSVRKSEDSSTSGLSNKMMRYAMDSYISEANGGLMRIAPLAIWAHTEPQYIYTQYARLDAMLSHSNIVCQDCNAVYVAAIVYLLKHHGDYKGAIDHLDDYINTFVFSKVKDWYFNDSLNIDDLDCKTHMGHVQKAFVLAIYFLRNNEEYESAIFKTLMKGGDTDTNAAIVGALIGALHGEKNIPIYMKNPVLNFDVTEPESGYKRPAMYNASNVHGLTNYLFTHKMARSSDN